MGAIRIGVGGWTFEPWRGTFYPAGLTQKRELEFASRALTSIEINGTYYSTFKPGRQIPDRKSTRLNSSHLGISYAVFCLKKKKLNVRQIIPEHRLTIIRSN